MSDWIPWIRMWPGQPSPYDHDLVQIRRGEDEAGQVINPRKDLHPLMNAADLWWRPWTGVTIDATSPPR